MPRPGPLAQTLGCGDRVLNPFVQVEHQNGPDLDGLLVT